MSAYAPSASPASAAPGWPLPWSLTSSGVAVPSPTGIAATAPPTGTPTTALAGAPAAAAAALFARAAATPALPRALTRSSLGLAAGWRTSAIRPNVSQRRYAKRPPFCLKSSLQQHRAADGAHGQEEENAQEQHRRAEVVSVTSLARHAPKRTDWCLVRLVLPSDSPVFLSFSFEFNWDTSRVYRAADTAVTVAARLKKTGASLSHYTSGINRAAAVAVTSPPSVSLP